MDFYENLKKQFSSLDQLKFDRPNDDVTVIPIPNKVLYCSYKDLDYIAFDPYKNNTIDQDLNNYLNRPSGDYPFNPTSPHFNIFGDWNKKAKDIVKEATNQPTNQLNKK
jgi:hypothetical protein